MTLFNMAFKNIRRNFNSYLIYFVSMVFSIMIYYVFTSIQYNQQVVALQEIKASIAGTFKTSSIVIALFAGIFIWYSNSFFIKRRKKEVGLYSLMGVKKKEIGRMLFYENLMMGILALVAGTILGSLLSKLFVMVLLRLMGYSIYVKFALLPQPVINTTIIFSILFLVTSFHGYSIIYRFKLIDLFKAENIGEKPPKTSWIVALLSVALIGGGYIYYMSAKRYYIWHPIITLAVVVTGTYLLFSYMSVYIIKLAKKNKASYYKGVNLVSTSQLMYRLKAHSKTLATIAVLSATTLTAMGVTSSFYYDFRTTLIDRCPFSYVYLSEEKGLDAAVDAIIAKYPEHPIKSSAEVELIKVPGRLPDVGYKEEYRNKEINVISESSYNRIAEVRGLKDRIYLDFYKDIVFIDPFYNRTLLDASKDNKLQLMLDGETASFNIKSFRCTALLNEWLADYMAVVDDDLYEQLQSEGKLVQGKAYIIEGVKDSEALTEELHSFFKGKIASSGDMQETFSAYYYRYKSEVATSGLTIFVGAFLGLVFLMATGSIIFFKQLSEANEDNKRYHILKNIGYGAKEIRAIISRQMLFVFMLPLFVGIMHSVVAVYILKKALGMNVFIPLIVTIGAYSLIYMIYYFLTVSAYSKLAGNGR